MIIDVHHHLWRYNPDDYGWMDGSMEILRRDYLPGELEGQLDQCGVAGTVVVQARQKTEETAWLLRLAEEHGFIKAVVGWVDLQSVELNRQLETFAPHPKLAGVRHVIQDEPDDGFMLRPEFLKGIEKLQQYRLSYDLLLFPRHLKRAAQLAGMFPDQWFVLDHIGKPPVRDGTLQPWQDDLAALAACPNVWCKVSGMVTEADHKHWRYEDLVPYLDVVTEAFGTDRIMLGSDWPVCLLAGDYSQVMDVGRRYFSGFGEEERKRIFSGNCKIFYNITS
jgi:L-fuconolactonase